MASNINTAIPPLGSPTTSGVRANFASAKTEIEALQTQIGYADYNDSATITTPISVSPSTWTKLTNNKLGPNTRIRLPSGVTNLWNSTTNQLVLTELPIDTMVSIRSDIIVTTSATNQVVKFDKRFAIGTGSEFTLEASSSTFKTAGVQKMSVNGSFYIGSDVVRVNPAELRLWSDASCTVVVNGWYISVVKYLAV